MIEALLLALALAMDCTAAAAVRGLVASRVRPGDVLRIAGLCGGFQGGMAAIGWLAGDRFGSAVESVDHWIAFGLLTALGVRTIVEGLRGGDDDERPEAADAFAWRPLLLLAVATSIDALVAGVTLPLLPVSGPLAVALIGGVSFALAAAGVYLGRALGARLGGRLEIAGGLALIAIGVKILVEHLNA